MKIITKIPLIECQGTQYQIGKRYGEECREVITVTVHTLFNEYSLYTSETKEAIIDIFPKYIGLLQDFDPDLYEFIRGEADGAGLDIKEVFLLWCHFELGFYYSKMRTLCTSFAVTGKATQDGKTIIGQNFDATLGRPVHILKKELPDGMKQLSLIFWGACELPLTSAGLAMVLNVVVSPADTQRLVLPSCCVIPKAMRQARIGDALGIFCSAGRSMMHYCLANREGDIISIETYPDDYSVLPPERDYLVHTNHYHTERFKKGELVYQGSPGSYIREPRIRRLIENNYGNITVESTMRFLSDHNNYPRSICNHPLIGAQPEGTLASVIMVPEDNLMYVAGGPPCEYEYAEYKL